MAGGDGGDIGQKRSWQVADAVAVDVAAGVVAGDVAFASISTAPAFAGSDLAASPAAVK